MHMGMKMSYQGAGEIFSLRTTNDMHSFPSLKGKLHLKIYDGPNATGKLLMEGTKDVDMTVLQMAQVITYTMFGISGQTIKQVTGATSSLSGTVNASNVQIAFGTGTAQGSWSDYTWETLAGGTNPVNATVSSISATLSSGQWNVTATWNNTTGATVTISELATEVIGSIGGLGSNYIVTHDVFTGQNVSNGGSAQATITFIMT